MNSRSLRRTSRCPTRPSRGRLSVGGCLRSSVSAPSAKSRPSRRPSSEVPSMPRLIPRIPQLLSDDQLQHIHQSALETIERVGIACDRTDVLDRLRERPNVRVEGDRIFLRAEDCDRMIREQVARRPEPSEHEGPISITVGGHNHHVIDLATDELRPMTLAAGIEGAKLIDALHDRGVRGGCPGPPTEVAPGLCEVTQALTSAQYTRHGPRAVITRADSARFVKEMHEVCGTRFSASIHVVSPLRLEGDEFHIALGFLEDESVSIGVTSMPMAGATAPVHLVGCLLTGAAETLATVCILKLLTREDRDFSFRVSAYAVDMQNGLIVYACPEEQLIEMLLSDLNRFYRATKATRSLKSQAKRVGAQAGLEMGAGLSAGALMGSDAFTTGLSLDEVFSAEKLILDCEARDWAERLQRGVRFDEETLSADLIAEVLEQNPRGNFFGHPSTAEHFRETYWLPALLDRNLLAGADTSLPEQARRRARAEARRLIDAHDFEPDPEQLRALEQIHARAERYFREEAAPE
ncbi:MAG: hypothetical protein GF393_09195 [Armatimonadia bacterium]|nr:hypothetical protein [Armatimonadia bacterium]